jgi:hypothetical protein
MRNLVKRAIEALENAYERRDSPGNIRVLAGALRDVLISEELLKKSGDNNSPGIDDISGGAVSSFLKGFSEAKKQAEVAHEETESIPDYALMSKVNAICSGRVGESTKGAEAVTGEKYITFNLDAKGFEGDGASLFIAMSISFISSIRADLRKAKSHNCDFAPILYWRKPPEWKYQISKKEFPGERFKKLISLRARLLISTKEI